MLTFQVRDYEFYNKLRENLISLTWFKAGSCNSSMQKSAYSFLVFSHWVMWAVKNNRAHLGY